MEAHYEAMLVEEVEGMKDELIERVDSYLESQMSGYKKTHSK